MSGEHDLLIDLHRGTERQGPGGTAETLRAVELAGLDRAAPLRIADLGCGTGASAKVLARALDADVIAVDTAEPFLEELRAAIAADPALARITTLNRSIDDLPFAEGELDVIWSEGAVYTIGFEAGVAGWRRFLKPGGTLVVSELTWLTGKRPAELHERWSGEYPEVDVASAKLAVLERHGYRPEGYFVLPERCWRDTYYAPLEARFDPFLERHGHRAEAVALVAAEREEIAFQRRYAAYVGYGVYVATRHDG
ncbi:MAG: class I SAM-dependent methyltransferase [Solirubrobacteraceae bacterium]|jgi:SAM-dependent methyltransferase|nr:class I SAM-dependent methyltransferase [Solirubrobacteraceae bacterium]